MDKDGDNGGHTEKQNENLQKPTPNSGIGASTQAAATTQATGTVSPPSPPVTAGLRYLPIPLDIGDAPIPIGMSEGDFEMLLATLQLWKKKIVAAPAAPAPTPTPVEQPRQPSAAADLPGLSEY